MGRSEQFAADAVRTSLTEADMSEIAEDYLAGVTCAQMAPTYDTSHQTIRAAVKRMGLFVPSRTSPRTAQTPDDVVLSIRRRFASGDLIDDIIGGTGMPRGTAVDIIRGRRRARVGGPTRNDASAVDALRAAGKRKC